jgi:hypothetical protein
MSEQNQPQTQDTDAVQSGPLNPGRRRLGTLGAGGTAIALSVTSRSAVAGWGSCSKSELASGNLSRDMTEANPCGCSPGYWWNNNGKTLWADPTVLAFASFRSSAMFNTVFGCNFLAPNKTLANCGPSTNPANTCGAAGNTAMHAIAALLNAAYYGSRYPVAGMTTPAGVITAFKNAFAAADKKKAFSDFVSLVDVYSSKPTWCQSKSHGGV